MAPAWAEFAGELGFSGIHWATVNEYTKDGGSHHVQEFLQSAAPALQARGLAQTWNFVDGFGWTPELDFLLAFPVWEALDSAADVFDNIPGGVVKRFPSIVMDGQSEKPIEFIERQWAKARCGGLSYLAIGDGSRALRNDFYPGARELSEAQIADLRRHVFTELACDAKLSSEGGQLTMFVEGLGAQDLQSRRGALGTALADVYGYGSCRVAEVGEVPPPAASGKVRALSQQAWPESPGLVISFHGECTTKCPSHDAVTVERLKEAVESALESWQSGAPVRIRSAEVRWPAEAAAAADRASKVEGGWPLWAAAAAAGAACCGLLAQRADILRRVKTALGSRELDGYACESPSMKVTGSQAPALPDANLDEADARGTPSSPTADELIDPLYDRLLRETTTIV